MPADQTLHVIKEPIPPDAFLEQFRKKYSSWGHIITRELEETWAQNCIVFNNVIAYKNEGIKYVVSAPTGSAKTENLITYCSMLPKEVKVLISTNLNDEASRLAIDINKESGEEDRAIAYNSYNNVTKDEAKDYQVVIVSHQFYRSNHTGNESWKLLGEDRDMIVIDEALETISEIQISKEDIELTLNFLLVRFKLLNEDSVIKKNIKSFQKDYEELSSLEGGTQKYGEDKFIEMVDASGKKVKASPITLHSKYALLRIGLSGENDDDRLMKKEKPYYELTKIKDDFRDTELRGKIVNVLKNFASLQNQLCYITAHSGSYSIHRVIDSTPTQSLVCLDATSDVNFNYALREEHKKDVFRVPKIPNVRRYYNVKVHASRGRTSHEVMTEATLKRYLDTVQFGNKTLIITQQKTILALQKVIKAFFSKHTIETAYWNKITGLNTWQDFDTCIILGLNNKPLYFSQNRLIANSTSEIAFSDERLVLVQRLQETDLVAEIIQAINRINIRKVNDLHGGCQEANIYVTLPTFNYDNYITLIAEHMPDMNIEEWKVDGLTSTGNPTSFEQLIAYLKQNIRSDEKVQINSPRDAIGINTETYKTLLGRTSKKKVEFEQKLSQHGFKVIEKMEPGYRDQPIKKKYFTKIDVN